MIQHVSNAETRLLEVVRAATIALDSVAGDATLRALEDLRESAARPRPACGPPPTRRGRRSSSSPAPPTPLPNSWPRTCSSPPPRPRRWKAHPPTRPRRMSSRLAR